MMKNKKKINNGYGIYIKINDESLKWLDWVKDQKEQCENFSEVVVEYLGDKKEFSLFDFLTKLGF
jgi:hypothetical protein